MMEIRIRDLLQQIRTTEPAMPRLLPDDVVRLEAIETATEVDTAPAIVVDLVRAYYGDFDRAQRTPRMFIYLHVGILCGLVQRSQR